MLMAFWMVLFILLFFLNLNFIISIGACYDNVGNLYVLYIDTIYKHDAVTKASTLIAGTPGDNNNMINDLFIILIVWKKIYVF